MKKPFTEQIREMREYIGTQSDVAGLIGVHPNYYARVERGECTLSEFRRNHWLLVMGDKVIEVAQSKIEQERKLRGII